MKTRRQVKTPLVKQIGTERSGWAEPQAAGASSAVATRGAVASSSVPGERRSRVETVSVRTAKATLSALLDQVAGGGEVVITSDGRPKARLVPMGSWRVRKVFGGDAEHLASMPPWRGGADATEWISTGRDERG